MLSWLADIVQILSTTENIWKGIVFCFMGYFGWKLFLELKQVRAELNATSQTFVKDGKPVDLVDAFTKLFAGREPLFQELLIDYKKVHDAQDAFMVLLRQFTESPWRFCEKFGDCPGVMRNADLLSYVKETVDAHFREEKAGRDDVKTHLENTAQEVRAALETVNSTAEAHRTRIEDLILKNSDDISRITVELARLNK